MSTHSKATFVPAKVETKTVELEPAKVVLEVSPEYAGMIRALIGKVEVTGPMEDLYNSLGWLESARSIPGFRAVNRHGPRSFLSLQFEPKA